MIIVLVVMFRQSTKRAFSGTGRARDDYDQEGMYEDRDDRWER